MTTSKHTHKFVEDYHGIIGLGLDRETDQSTIICYLQKFSDDTLMHSLISRMSDDELQEVFVLINRLLKRHLSEGEYHSLFLKDR